MLDGVLIEDCVDCPLDGEFCGPNVYQFCDPPCISVADDKDALEYRNELRIREYRHAAIVEQRERQEAIRKEKNEEKALKRRQSMALVRKETEEIKQTKKLITKCVDRLTVIQSRRLFGSYFGDLLAEGVTDEMLQQEVRSIEWQIKQLECRIKELQNIKKKKLKERNQ